MTRRFIAALFLIVGIWYVTRFQSIAQGQNPGGARGGQRPQAYPDRPKAAQEIIDRGKATYGVSCAFCHGSDAGGGEGGPNLLRSGIVLADQAGELIAPITHGARIEKGMPRIDVTDAQVSDIAAWLHSLKVSSRTDAATNIDIVRGDASAGQVYFEKTCASCHSITGDLKGFASKMPNPRTLQQTWMLPGGGGRGPGGGGPPPGIRVSPVTVTVTLSSGEKVTGVMNRIDDYFVGVTEQDGTVRGFTRKGNLPKVEIHDPLEPHRELLRKYQDKDIHDLTAYLVTLK